MRSASLALAAASLLSIGAGGSAAPSPRRIYGYENIRRYLQRKGRSRRSGNFDAQVNRWTGEPHRHGREIARRLRQQARAA